MVRQRDQGSSPHEDLEIRSNGVYGDSPMSFNDVPGRTTAEKATYILAHGTGEHEGVRMGGGSSNAAFGGGIGNLQGWMVFFGAVGLILAGLLTRSWIGAAVGAGVLVCIPVLIARVARGPEVFDPIRGRRLAGGKATWTLLFGLLGAGAGYEMAFALDVTDEIQSFATVIAVFAVFGALVGLVIRLLIGARRRRQGS